VSADLLRALAVTAIQKGVQLNFTDAELIKHLLTAVKGTNAMTVPEKIMQLERQREALKVSSF
jgi:hypothetical protein